MGSHIHPRRLTLPLLGFGVGPIQGQQDFPSIPNDCRNQVATRDLHIHPALPMAPMPNA